MSRKARVYRKQQPTPVGLRSLDAVDRVPCTASECSTQHTAYGRREAPERANFDNPTRGVKALSTVYRLRSTSSPGYAFVVLIIAMTVMLIGLATALPSVYHESQREKEEELVFRGNEYARAIYLFQIQFKRFPKSVDELIRTNNIRFLRHAYKDPMNPKGKWRFIHVAPNGMLIDSLTMGPQAQAQFVGASGQSAPGQSAFGQSASDQSGFGQSGSGQSGFGQSGFGQSGFGQSGSGQSGFGQGASGQGGFGQSGLGQSSSDSSQSPFHSGDSNGFVPQPSNDQSQSSSAFGQNQSEQGNQDTKETKKEKLRAACQSDKSESAFFSDNQSQGTLIGGVASCSDKSSIRVWNKKTKYEEWEFLGVGFQVAAFPGLPQPQPQNQSGTGGQITQPGQGFGVGQGGVGPGGPGSTPPGVQQPQNPPQNPPDAPLTDQPVDSPETPHNPPQQ
jgi:type II secretory pathway pseudopilin PulG